MKSKQLKNSQLGLAAECEKGAAKREQKYWYDWLRIKRAKIEGVI